MKNRPKELIGDLVYPGLALVVLLVAWEAVGRLGLAPRYILPTPTEIVSRIIEMDSLLLWNAWVTGIEIILGFVLSLLTGVGLAVAVVYIRPFERAFYPWIVATQAIPKVALGPLILVWFGFGLLPKILIVCLLAFFPVMIGTAAGLRSIERDSMFLMRSMGADKVQMFWYAQLPNGLPSIFASMKVAIILSAVGAIVAEFIGANEGIGYILLASNASIDTELLFAALIIISILATILYWVVALFEKAFVGWHVSIRERTANATG